MSKYLNICNYIIDINDNNDHNCHSTAKTNQRNHNEITKCHCILFHVKLITLNIL